MAINLKEHIYRVQGMRCASCEILIEKKLLELGSVKSVEASNSKDSVLIEYDGGRLTLDELNGIFKKEGYIFSDSHVRNRAKAGQAKEFLLTLGIGLLIIFSFIGLNKSGLSGLINVNSKSSLPVFFMFGLIAGISSCAALVGGIILSMSKQWSELYSDADSAWKKIQPHLIFNIGRLVSYGVFGMLLGAIGSKLNLSFGPILVIVVSLAMIFLAFQMFGFKMFRKLQFTMPKFITRFIADESNFKGRHMPFLMGAFTFFLPCGFTITIQGLALISGSAIQGGLMMFLFALGTMPMLLFIGLSSVKFSQKPHLSNEFLKVAGILVLFFAVYNINFQLNVLGISNFSDLSANNSFQSEKESYPIINGKQIIKMDASSYGYSPNYFTLKAEIPVRWEITDKGTSGCTNAVIAKSLFKGEIPLTPGQTSIKEFTPKKLGKYKFSCWMGMISGVIEVVENVSSNDLSLENFLSVNNAPVSVKEAYLFALKNPDDILNQMPCYCGCIERGVHKNNRDCFINSDSEGKNDDYFDKMGLNCGTCVDIALAAKNLQEQGKSEKEIKDIINKLRGAL